MVTAQQTAELTWARNKSTVIRVYKVAGTPENRYLENMDGSHFISPDYLTNSMICLELIAWVALTNAIRRLNARLNRLQAELSYSDPQPRAAKIVSIEAQTFLLFVKCTVPSNKRSFCFLLWPRKDTLENNTSFVSTIVS
uniref:Uncharacterized protein n=1 Tax=Glossina pallidipes TaxID=7398 RepID=A0A1B0AJ62_GLOPL